MFSSLFQCSPGMYEHTGAHRAQGCTGNLADAICAALPLAHLLYGSATQLKHHFPGREAEYVDFLDGLSQGCPSGLPSTMLALHLALHITLSKHPDMEVRILGIVDDLNLLGKIRDCVIIYFDLKILFKNLFGTDLNMQKSSLLALQMHTVIDPTSTSVVRVLHNWFIIKPIMKRP